MYKLPNSFQHLQNKHFFCLFLIVPRLYRKYLKIAFLVHYRARRFKPLQPHASILKNILWYHQFTYFFKYHSISTTRKNIQWRFFTKKHDLTVLLSTNKFQKIHNNSLKFKIRQQIKISRTHLAYLCFLRRNHKFLVQTVKFLYKDIKTPSRLLQINDNWNNYFFYLNYFPNKAHKKVLPNYSSNGFKFPIHYKIFYQLLHTWWLKLDYNSKLHHANYVDYNLYNRHINYKIPILRPERLNMIYIYFDIVKYVEFDFTTMSMRVIPTHSSYIPYFLMMHTHWANLYMYNWQLEF